MGLNGEAEKLRQAEEWLLHNVAGVTRLHRNAAWEYVVHVARNSADCELRSQAVKIIAQYRRHPS